MEKSKALRVLSTSAMTGLITAALGSTAYAKTTDILAKDSNGKQYQYSYEDLKNSLMGDKVLFNEFKTRQVVAYKDDKAGYVDFTYLTNKYMDIGKKNFVLDVVTEATPSANTIMPAGTITPRVVNNGTVQDGTPISVKTVSSVSSIANITVANGTAAANLGLPSTVAVTLSDNTTANASITWNTAGFDGTVAGDHTITGALSAPNGASFTSDAQKTVSVKVTVQAAGLAVGSVSAVDASGAATVAALDGATAVANNSTFKATFSQTLNAATVNANNVKLVRASDSVPVATATPVLSSDKKSILVSPIAGTAFTKNTQYKLILKAGIQSEDGTMTLSADKTVATFTTADKASLVDFEDNTNTSIAYSGNDAAVATGNHLYLEFSEAIDPTSMTTSNVKLRNITDGSSYEAVTLAAAASNTKIQINIDNAEGLTAGKIYEVTFNGLRTANGGDVVSGSWRFVANGTVPAINTNALMTSNAVILNDGSANTGWGKINSGTLGDGTLQSGVKFYATFNTDLDQSTLGAITLIKSSDGSEVDVTRDYDSTFRRVVLTPKADLAENTAYQVKISTALKSSTGIAYAATTTSDTYTTYDLTKPAVTGVTEATNNLQNLPVGQATTIAINFSEAVREYQTSNTTATSPSAGSAFSNADSVRIRNLTGNVAMTNTPVISMSSDNKTMYITVTPAAGEENRTFEISLNAKDGTNAYICDNVNATDAQKNSIAEDYTFTFTTAGADTIAPTVEKVFFGSAYSSSATAVASGTTNIDASKNMYVVFSEPMAGATTDKVSIDNTGAVAGTQNVELWARPVGGSYALVAADNSDANAGAAASKIRFTTSNGKSYLTIDNADIATDKQYKLVITPSTDAVEDLTGNDMASTFTYEFATTGTLAWADPTTTVMGTNKDTIANAIAAGAGSANGAVVTSSNDGATIADDDVLALEMTDGSFYFEKFNRDNADTTTANNELIANLPAGNNSVAQGATVVDMTNRSASFASLDSGYTVSDPIAVRLDAAAGVGVDVSTVNTSNIKLVKVSDGSSVPYSLYYRTIGNSTFISINPTSDLDYSAAYEVQVSNVKDMLGNIITARNARFTTAVAPANALAITSATPTNNTMGYSVNGDVKVTFNESVADTNASGRIQSYNGGGAAANITAGTITAAGTNALANTTPNAASRMIALHNITDNQYETGRLSISADGKTVTILPDSILEANKVYQIEVGGGLTSNNNPSGADTAIGAASTYTFKTETIASVRPEITDALYIDNDGSGTVNAGDLLVVTFNTGMNTATIPTASGDHDALFGLTLSGAIDGAGNNSTAAWSADGKTVTLTLGTNPVIVPGATKINGTVTITTTNGVAIDTDNQVTIKK